MVRAVDNTAAAFEGQASAPVRAIRVAPTTAASSNYADPMLDPSKSAPSSVPSQRPNAPRSVGSLAPILIAGLLLATLAGAWWLYIKAAAKARIEARYAQAARKAAEADAALGRQFAAQQAAVAVQSGNASAAAADEQVVEDSDGRLLWASPTAGAPISLSYVPAGTQCLVSLRLAALAGHPEGEKILAALGPWGMGAVARLETIVGAKFAEIDAVLVSIVVSRDRSLDACLRVEMHGPWDDAELARRQPDAQTLESGGLAYLAAGDRAWFLAPSASGGASRTLVCCPVEMADKLIESDGTPPLAARDIESLVAQSDADRTATVMLGAKFLAAGGGYLVDGQAAPLRDAVAALLGNDATAAALSAHWGDSFFVELRATPALIVSPRWLATTMQQRVVDGGETVAAGIDSQTWSEYGRAVLARLPAMLGKLASFTRSGEADKHAVLRAYLPAAAGHNLLMGAELLLTQRADAVEHAHADEGMPRARTMDERLATVTSLAFPKETLQRALELLAEDVGAAIEIDGPALQAEGITQNQTLAIDLHERPAGEILVEILRLANPDRTADGPADPRQKLVYVVEPVGENGGRMIVTTRSAAEKTGLPLPAVFGGSGE